MTNLPSMSPAQHAEAFMTEFNQNSRLFGQLLIPWVSEIAQMLPEIVRQNADLTTLNNDVGQMREKVLYLEGQLGDDALADALTAEQLTGDDCAEQQTNTSYVYGGGGGKVK